MPSPLPPFASVFEGPLPELPQQAPFRLLDRIVAADVAGGYLVAERRLTCNDALWPAESHALPHFFGAARAVFPSTLLIEALCQAAACLNALAPPAAAVAVSARAARHHGYLVAVSDVRFPTFAYVGETIALEVRQAEKLGSLIAFSARATAVAAAPASDPETDPESHPESHPESQSLQPREVASGRLLFAVTWA